MDEKLKKELKAAAERNAKLLSKMEEDTEYLERAENFQREIGEITIESLHKQFNI